MADSIRDSIRTKKKTIRRSLLSAQLDNIASAFQIYSLTSLRLIDWGLTALSAQKRLYRAFDKYAAVKKVKLIGES